MEQFKNEIWKPISINPIYQVSNYGRVKTLSKPIWCGANNSYSIRKEKILSLNDCNSKHYLRVGIVVNCNGINKQKQFAVHRLVAQAFIPNPMNLPQVNHIDGNKQNNHVDNLEWCTNEYNMQHAVKNGLSQTEQHRKARSEKCWMRKLTYEQVLFIRTEWDKINKTKKGEKSRFCNEMKQQFNLKSANTIYWIIGNKYRTNKFLNQDLVQTTNFEKYKKEREDIIKNRVVNKTITDYAKDVGVTYAAFSTKLRQLKDPDRVIQYYSERKKPLSEYAKELGVTYAKFSNAYLKRFNKNLEKTIEYCKIVKRKSISQASKELSITRQKFRKKLLENNNDFDLTYNYFLSQK